MDVEQMLHGNDYLLGELIHLVFRSACGDITVGFVESAVNLSLLRSTSSYIDS